MDSPCAADNDLLVQSEELVKLDWLRHASTTRRFNAPDAPREPDLNRLQQMMGVSSQPLILCQQKHTNHVEIVSEELMRKAAETGRHVFPNTDGVVCPFPGVTLVIITADCAPVFLVDTRREIIGLVHAGWRGTRDRIVENAIRQMQSLGSDAKDITAWLGPMANACCYEVSEELISDFQGAFPDASQKNVEFARGRHLDLVELNSFQLENCGVSPVSILRSNYCTIHQREDFYSYRADGGTHGRIFSMLAHIN